ncbi:MAG: hypothetical protein JNK90_02945 [Planctomycetaceae bacterium]|nr:hypothetical protein [Planctomycetaceae bacterium]
MTFFRIFKGKAERDFELRSKLRQAYNKIDLHVRKLDVQRQKYLGLARRAHSLRDLEQFEDFAQRYHHTLTVIQRWQKYQLKLNALEIQRDEVRASEEFLSGIGVLTQSILQGVKPEEVNRIVHDIEIAEERCAQLEQTMEEQLRNVLQPVLSGSNLDEAALRGVLGHEENSFEPQNTTASSVIATSLASSRNQVSKMSFEEALRHYQVAE